MYQIKLDWITATTASVTAAKPASKKNSFINYDDDSNDDDNNDDDDNNVDHDATDDSSSTKRYLQVQHLIPNRCLDLDKDLDNKKFKEVFDHYVSASGVSFFVKEAYPLILNSNLVIKEIDKVKGELDELIKLNHYIYNLIE